MEKKYPMYCSWCKAKGKKTITGYSSIEHSSGICPKCAKDLMKEVKAMKSKRESLDDLRTYIMEKKPDYVKETPKERKERASSAEYKHLSKQRIVPDKKKKYNRNKAFYLKDY